MSRLLAFILLAATSTLAATPAECWKLRKLSRPLDARACFLQLADSTRPAEMAEGFWGLGEFEKAGAAFRIAAVQEPKNPDIRVRWGRLLLERFNVTESSQLFRRLSNSARTTPPLSSVSQSPSRKASTAAPSTSPARPSKATPNCAKPRNSSPPSSSKMATFPKPARRRTKRSPSILSPSTPWPSMPPSTCSPINPNPRGSRKCSTPAPPIARLRPHRPLVCPQPPLCRGD